MAFWNRKKEVRDESGVCPPVSADLLQLLVSTDTITKREALAIPSVAASVDLISGVIAALPVCLYRDKGDDVELVEQDQRLFLLNDESGDLLDSYQMKKAWVEDYLLTGAGYLYINRKRNRVESLHYVDSSCVSANVGVDPIFKTADILVNGATYREFEFVRLIRQTKNGVTGMGIVSQYNLALAVMYHALKYENFLVKTGGNKKGFLKAKSRITKEAVDNLKESFRRLYSTDAESVIVLNDGVEFQEAANTSVDMQLNENKKTNAHEACKMFHLPPSILDGTAGEDDWALAMKICFQPILTAMETAFNRELLLENEKRAGGYYFAVDTKELLKGDILKRFQAYQLAVDSNIMQVDEVRYREDLPALGLDFVKLGLQDVLYNPATKELYTPNTDKSTNLLKGGENIESGNPSGQGAD